MDTSIYKTQSGRIVHGGGGIIPDSVILEKIPSFAVQSLFVKDMFFRFANYEYPKMKSRKVKVDKDFQLTDDIRKDFYRYLDSTGFKYQSLAQIRFKEFRLRAGLSDSAADSIKSKTEEILQNREIDAIKKATSDIESVLTQASDRVLHETGTDIDRYLTESILIREFGQDNEVVYRRQLGADAQLQAAIGILRHKDHYQRFLSPAKK